MGNGYEVDLSYLQDTLKKLQSVADGMDTASGVANYQTNLGPSWLGNGFIEVDSLNKSHDEMKNRLTGMISTLQSMIQEFHDKTSHAHAQYSGTDSSVKGTFSRGA